MADLLDTVIAAHGGLARWREISLVTAELTSWGLTWSTKGQPDLFAGVTVNATTARETLQVHPFTDANRRGYFTPERVWIQQQAGGPIIEQRDRPRSAFVGHTLSTPWDHLHGLYFGGYALWTYLNLPFLAARPDIAVTEIAAWGEAPGQRWRRLRLQFPPEIATHNPVQDLYINADGLIVRHDYAPEVVGANPAAHYLYDQADYDGIIFPRRRKVFPRNADNTPSETHGDNSVLIGIDFTSYALT